MRSEMKSIIKQEALMNIPMTFHMKSGTITQNYPIMAIGSTSLFMAMSGILTASMLVGVLIITGVGAMVHRVISGYPMNPGVGLLTITGGGPGLLAMDGFGSPGVDFVVPGSAGVTVPVISDGALWITGITLLISI